MAQRWGGWYWHFKLASLLVMGGAMADFGDCVLAQITPDSTLESESSVVTPTNINGRTTERIDGGATRGANLFHSFEQFSIPTGGAAYFNNAANIQNIISRVTGSSVSHIDGLIRANRTANLFLLNPNGIIFHSNTSLKIGGSFLASTASAVNFADGTQFSAIAPQIAPLLTVSVPLGLQFGGTAGGIQVQESGLQVERSQTLALIGGDVSVEGGFLQALGSRIELGGLAGAGIVEIEGQQSQGAFGLTKLHFPDSVERADVWLTNSAFVNVAASGGGSIAINARKIDISDGSELRGGLEENSGFPGAKAGDISLNATGAINVANGFIRNRVREGAVGNGGNINISTESLAVTYGARLSASTRGQGDAGSVNINARDTISFNGFNGVGSNTAPSGAFSSVEAGAMGNGGSIDITTRSLSVTNRAQLYAGTHGLGNAGSVTIRAGDTVSFDGQSGAFSSVEEGAMGNGSSIDITTRSLSVTNGAQLFASTRGLGNAGSVTIRAGDTVSFDGVGSDKFSPSAAFSFVEDKAVGNGGDINIITGTLAVRGVAQLLTRTSGRGNAGNVTIHAGSTVSLAGFSGNKDPTIGSDVSGIGAVGNGGDIKITAPSVFLENEAIVAASILLGRGENGRPAQAGDVMITSSDQVSLNNSLVYSEVGLDSVGNGGTININAPFVSLDNRAALVTQIRDRGSGNGGDMKIMAGSLSVTNGAQLTASSKGSGAAGNIQVAANSIRLENLAMLSSNTTGGQGKISLHSQDLVLRRGSNITTDATGTATGGNISIDTDILVALENSDISANASEGPGGRMKINASGIFGTQFRNQLTPKSDITASSNLGPQFNGIVEINTPDIDPSQGLTILPAQLVEVSGLIATGCAAVGENEFKVTGRGGLPPNPGEPLSSDVVWEDTRLPATTANQHYSETVTVTPPSTPTTVPIVEATGWVFNDKGEVTLTAQEKSATLNIPWLTPATCHTPKPSS